MSGGQSALLLQRQLKSVFPSWHFVTSPSAHQGASSLITCHIDLGLTKDPVEGFSAGLKDESNVYEWEIFIMGPSDTP